MAGSGRGSVGVGKLNSTTGSPVEFIRLLLEGINVIPARAGLREYSVEGFREPKSRSHGSSYSITLEASGEHDDRIVWPQWSGRVEMH